MAVLYDDTFLSKAIKGDYAYGTTVELNGPEHVLLWFLKLGMLLVYLIIWVCARIPLIGAITESLVTFYPRGAPGFFLRGCYYKQVLGHLGRNTLIDIGVSIFNPRNVSIGDNTHIDTYVKIEGGGPVKIGSYNHICSFTLLAGRGGITTEDFVSITAGSKVYSASNHYSDGRTDTFYVMAPVPIASMQYVHVEPIVLEEHSFVGMQSIVMPGVRLGRGSIIGAGSFVQASVPPWSVAIGSPARVVKERWPRPPGWNDSAPLGAVGGRVLAESRA